MKKRILAIMACAVLALSACGKANVKESSSESESSSNQTTVAQSSENEESLGTIKLGGLKGPTSMGMVKLLDDAKKGSLSYSVSLPHYL